MLIYWLTFSNRKRTAAIPLAFFGSDQLERKCIQRYFKFSSEALEQEFVQRESDSSSEDEDASVMDVEDDVEIGNEDEGERDDEVSVSWYVNNSCY